MVGINYISTDKKYCVTIVFEPQLTNASGGYQDVDPNTYIVRKIESK